MTTRAKAPGQQALAPPRGAAIAGVIFSVLMVVCLGLVRYAIPVDFDRARSLVGRAWSQKSCRACARLGAVRGIAFLWFIGVLRSRLGELEDQFFATVFLGSGLLFVASLFGVAAAMRALVETMATGQIDSVTYYFGRQDERCAL
jgi:hypothetical protein